MAHLIMHGEAPLASGDELTPSLEYTLDEPNPLHADDLAERDQPTPSSDEKPDTPPESPTPEGDNTVTLERQPIYAQVTKKADREPKEDKDKDKDRDSSSDKDKKDDSSGDEGKDDSKKKKKDKKNKKKDKDKDEPSEKEKKPKEKTIKIRYRVDKGMPKHRSRCVACGCARICCVENFVFLWVVLFILIQAGPLSVLVWDFLNVNSHGIAISRYIAEWNMQPAVCRVESMEFTDLSTCDCLLSNTRCKEPIAEYGCMQVKASIFTYNHTGPISNGSHLWKSEREYVLDKTSPKCFNLDICKIDKTNPWHAYRNQTIRDKRLLRDKWNEEEGFVCYYKEIEDDSYIAVMEMNTSIWQVLLWFFLPLLGILLCWVIICTCLCWYCCPPARYVTRIKKKNGGGNYHEVVSAEQDEAGGPEHEHDPNAIKEPLCYDDRGGEHMQGRPWPTSGGPGAASDAAAF